MELSSLLGWYVLFAATTALVAAYELFWPVLQSLKLSHPELVIVQNIWLSMMVFMLMAFVLAPLTILPCLVPKLGDRFRKNFWEGLLEQ